MQRTALPTNSGQWMSPTYRTEDKTRHHLCRLTLDTQDRTKTKWSQTTRRWHGRMCLATALEFVLGNLNMFLLQASLTCYSILYMIGSSVKYSLHGLKLSHAMFYSCWVGPDSWLTHYKITEENPVNLPASLQTPVWCNTIQQGCQGLLDQLHTYTWHNAIAHVMTVTASEWLSLT